MAYTGGSLDECDFKLVSVIEKMFKRFQKLQYYHRNSNRLSPENKADEELLI
jgi:hypothetical protein